MSPRSFDLYRAERVATERAYRVALIVVRRYYLTKHGLAALRRKGGHR